MTHTQEVRWRASEIKFVVDADTGERIRSWARSFLEPDPHGAGAFGDEYRTSTLYFDTAEGDVFHQRGSFGRAKYRIRRYGRSDVIFLERKLRQPGLLVKRRTEAPLDFLDGRDVRANAGAGLVAGSSGGLPRGAWRPSASSHITVWPAARQPKQVLRDSLSTRQSRP